MRSRSLMGLATAVLLVPSTGVAQTSNRITTEAIDEYPGCFPLQQNHSNVGGFMLGMLSGRPPLVTWAAGVINRFDSSVLGSDFRDPQRIAGGNDLNFFDRAGDAISYFSGHGTCNSQTTTACTTDAQCPNIGTLAQSCTRFAENPLQGRCMNARDRALLTNNCVGVDLSDGTVKLGESGASGNWSGAGTNGGINFAVFDISCGATPDYLWQNYGAAFAGVHGIATVMPTRVGDDTADVPDRGLDFASRYLASDANSVALSWLDALSSVSGGAACVFGGGSLGINGCGAHVVTSVGPTVAAAQNYLLQSWVGMRDDATDATSNAFVWGVWSCNYDCNAHPWNL